MQDLKPKSGEAAESNESKASIWRYVINPEGKISDIHFLTQLTPEEKQVMLKDPGMGTGQLWRSQAVLKHHSMMLVTAT